MCGSGRTLVLKKTSDYCDTAGGRGTFLGMPKMPPFSFDKLSFYLATESLITNWVHHKTLSIIQMKEIRVELKAFLINM